MKKAVLAIALTLLGCSSEEASILGDYGNNVPLGQKAEIFINGDQGELNVQFQKDSTWPAIHEKLSVSKVNSGYELRLLSNNVKLNLVHTDSLTNRFVCTDCFTYEPNRLPVIWFKKN